MVFIPQGFIQNSLLKLQGTVIRITQPPLKHGARSALLNSCLSQNMTNSKIRRSKHPLLSMVESSCLLYHISTDSRYRFETVNLYYIDILQKAFHDTDTDSQFTSKSFEAPGMRSAYGQKERLALLGGHLFPLRILSLHPIFAPSEAGLRSSKFPGNPGEAESFKAIHECIRAAPAWKFLALYRLAPGARFLIFIGDNERLQIWQKTSPVSCSL